MDKTLEIELAQIRPKVLSTAQRFFRVSGLDGDPEDVVQDVLLRLWEARCRGDEIRNAEAWAMAITKNCCVSLWRKSRKETVLPLRDEFVAGHTPSGKMEEKEVEASVTKALERIPSATLYLLRLRAKGLSLDEIAAVTGRPKGSIKSSISTARKEIMKRLTRNKNGPERVDTTLLGIGVNLRPGKGTCRLLQYLASRRRGRTSRLQDAPGDYAHPDGRTSGGRG